MARHLTLVECQTLRKLAEEAGHVEILRVLAAMVGNDHPDLHAGDQARKEINKIANSLQKNGLGST